MSLAIGSRVGLYEIVALIGAGGMGEVYRARDTKLDRLVAIKILPESFAQDPERLARFEREAKTLAALNHPNIATIYGVEDADGMRAIAMELVEGPTLAEQLAGPPEGGPHRRDVGSGFSRIALPLDEALPIARQIAEALEAAHEHGIIHRDLKPANIKLRPDGAVKVLDFGLAKALDASGRPEDRAYGNREAVSQLPTITSPAGLTGMGMLLGTAAYMAPEQARGRPVDRRADIWAFGCVLFEMLAGRRPFDGEDVAETIGAIIHKDPPWSALPASTPAVIRRLLQRCLEKDPKQRRRDIGDAGLEIEDAERGGPTEPVSLPSTVSRGERAAWAAMLLIVGFGAAVAGRWALGQTPDTPETRVELVTPATSLPMSFAISPDGRKIVFTATGANGSLLWMRSLDAASARPLPGTDRGQFPFWSPDGRSIGFFADYKLKKIDLDASAPQPLANVLTPAGGSWNREGTIIYVPADNGGVFRIPATGGDPSPVTPRGAGMSMRYPHFLPDGRNYLVYVAVGPQPAGVYLGELGTGKVQRILAADGPATYASGHLLFVRQNVLMAQAFNPTTFALSDPIQHVADNVTVGSVSWVGVSPSSADSIAYRTGTARGRNYLVWFDRSGREISAADAEQLPVLNPSLSPDGRRIAVQAALQDNPPDIWLLELERNIFRRLTSEPGIEALPIWSADGTRVLFNRQGLQLRRVDGSASDEVLLPLTGSGPAHACDWSSDDRFMLYRKIDQGTGTYDLWALPLSGDRTPLAVARTAFDERDGQFSPDTKWVAYQSDETGRPEIYVQPFPGPGEKIRVSIDGGTQVRWRADGQELFYIAPDNDLMSVPLDIEKRGSPRVDRPVPLFQTRIVGTSLIHRQQYVVARDGQRFLINTVRDEPTAPITLILNWNPTAQH